MTHNPFHEVAGRMAGKWAEVLIKGITDLFRSIFMILWSVGVLGISPILLLLFFVLHVSHPGEYDVGNNQGADRHE